MALSPTISVIICAYTLDRWDDLSAAVESVRCQTSPAEQLIVVIDYNDELLARARDAFAAAGVTVVGNELPRGLSGARNTGLGLATAQVVAFLDDDAVASPTWLAELAEGYTDDHVLGVGGFIAPLWEASRPGWFPEEFDWVLGCTYRGMAEGTKVRNLIGANMSMRRDVLAAVGGFSSELGRTSTTALGDEETGACIRASQLYPDGVFLHTGHARVEHRVPASRTTWRYFIRRCWGEGLSKAHLARTVGSRDGLSSERRHVLVALPLGALRAFGSLFAGDWSGPARAVAIVAGLAATVTGYVAGRLTPEAPTAADGAAPPVAAAPAATPAPATALAAPPERRRMRVLMVTPRFFPQVGGVEHHVAEVARRLAADADVTVLTTDTSRTLPAAETVDGVDVRRVHAWPRDRDYHVAPGLWREIVKGDWDVVHVQSVHTAVAPLAMLAALRAGTPYVLTFHGGGHSSAVRESMRGLQWTLLRPLLARARVLIAVARFEAERFSAALGLPLSRFVVIPNGSDLPAIPAEESVALQTQAGQLLVSVGRLERYKGHHRVIEAMPAVLAELPDARLRVIGAGPAEAELHALVERLGLGDRVLIGAIAPTDRLEMTRALAAASLTVLMSEFETHPLAIIEALSLGRPALVADTSGLRELAEQGLARALPLDATADELAAAIVEELRCPRTTRIVHPPTWDECAASLRAVYSSAVSPAENAAKAGAVGAWEE